jgi:hypothetical protein
MPLRVLNLLSVLSLLLCVAVTALWVRSLDHMTSWVVRAAPEADGGETVAGFCCVQGGLYWMTHHRKATEGGRTVTFLDREVPPAATPHFFGTPDTAALGFEMNRAQSRWAGPDDPGYVRVPLWALAAVTSVLPAARLVARRRRARRRGTCRSCGYDLTGNVSGVCPECGATAK